MTEMRKRLMGLAATAIRHLIASLNTSGTPAFRGRVVIACGDREYRDPRQVDPATDHSSQPECVRYHDVSSEREQVAERKEHAANQED